MNHPFHSSNKDVAQRWSQWQPDAPQHGDEKRPDGQPERRKAGKHRRTVALKDFDPSAKPFSLGDKLKDKAATESIAQELDTLQNLFYADKRYKLLVILQGTDTAGKDGTIRGVFGRMSALGVHAVGWSAPTEAERAHDYLWRIHQKVPGAGEITVFNRSHYEDVLVPAVNGWITPSSTTSALATSTTSSACSRTPAPSCSSSCCTSALTSSVNACRSAWTTRPSTGSSR